MHIVTGGAGFIGSAFIWKLNQMGIDDIIVVDELGKSNKWNNLKYLKFSDFIHKDDLLMLVQSNSLPTDIEAVIHLGACSSTTETDADYFMKNNFQYSKTLAEWSLMHRIRFLYASSAATYGNGSHGFSDNEDQIQTLEPLNIYGYSKHLFDLWLLKNRLMSHVVGFKFFNVFGPNEYHKGDMASIVYKAYHQIKKSGHVKLFKSYRTEYADGAQMRDFLYIKDCVDMMWAVLINKNVVGIYNIGSAHARTWNDLAKSIFESLNIETQIEYIEMPINIREQYQYYTQADMQKLEKAGCLFQWGSLEKSVDDYVTQYLEKENSYLH